MLRRTLPQIPRPRASEAEDSRLDLLSVLRRKSSGIEIEALFAEAGYRGDQVDQFFRDLTQVRESIDIITPTQAESRWPFFEATMVRIKHEGPHED